MRADTKKRPRENALMRLIELGLKEGLLARGSSYPEENLKDLLDCVKVGFADYLERGMELEEFCKIILDGFCVFAVENPQAFEECARAYLQGIANGVNLSRRNLDLD